MSKFPEDSPVIGYVSDLYAELERRAALDSGGKLKFEGSKVDVFRSLKVSQTHYSVLFKVLTELGCIEQIKRGDRHYPSVLLLHGAPNREQIESMYRSRLTKRTSVDTMQSWVSQLERRIERLEQEVGLNASQQANPNTSA